MKKYPILMYHSISTPPKNTAIPGICVSEKKFNNQMNLLKKLGYKCISMEKLIPYLKGEKIGKVIGLTFDDGYLDNIEIALPILKKYDFSATCYIVSDQIGGINAWDIPRKVAKRKLMDEKNMQQWLEADCEIGVHTATHQDLSKCDQTTLETEIISSKKKLEEILKIKTISFCYPYGAFNEKTVATVKEANFTNSTTTIRGRATQNDDFFILPRVSIAKKTSLIKFMLKVFTPYEDLKNRS